MKKSKKIAGASLFVLGLLYGGGIAYASNNVLPNTTISAREVSNFDQESISDIVNNQVLTLRLKDDRGSITIDMSELDFVISNLDTIKSDVIAQQNVVSWPLTLINGQDINAISVSVEADALNRVLRSHDLFNNTNLTRSSDASFELNQETHQIVITDEVVGEVLDRDLTTQYILDNLKEGNFDIDLSKTVVQPQLTSSDLNGVVASIEEKIATPIQLSVSNSEFVLQPSKDDLLSFIEIDKDNQSVSVDKGAILNYVRAFNAGVVRHSDSNHVYRVQSGTSTRITEGSDVIGFDEFSATALIYDSLVNDVALERAVDGSVLANPRVTYEGVHTTDGNLIEIDIQRQTLFFYKQGELVLTAPVVTGRPGWDTRVGKFQIDWMARNFTLRGASVGNNLSYEIPVQYWIPFDEHIGLHDLSSRSEGEFGGNTFRTAGSHGCVNMRLSDVRFIFNNVEPGTGVWVH